MKASIYRDTKYEISWSIDDDPITPDLIERIEDAGRELEINWKRNEFYKAVLLLLEKYSPEEIESKIYDEDPNIIELIALGIQSPLDQDSDHFITLAKLYLPVVIIILRAEFGLNSDKNE